MAKKKLDHEALHRELWNWIAENITKDFFDNKNIYSRSENMYDLKDKWPGWKKIKEEIDNNCFACHFCGVACEKCPITWGKEPELGFEEYDPFCEGYLDSPYRLLVNDENLTVAKAKKLALKIANLEWKPK